MVEAAASADKQMPFTNALLTQHGHTLIETAKASIDHGLGHGEPLRMRLDDHPAALQASGATFVTLYLDGRLRGCVGSAEPHRPLINDIAINAYGAAFQDPRFPPLTTAERVHLELTVSLLTPLFPISFRDEADLLRHLRPGLDGLVIESGRRRALFLPQVWEMLPRAVDFLAHLKLKAGLDADQLPADVSAWRFSTVSLSSSSIAPPQSAM